MNRADKRAAKRGEKKQKRGARLKGTPSAINNQGRISRLEGYLGQMAMEFRNVMQNQHHLNNRQERLDAVLSVVAGYMAEDPRLTEDERAALEEFTGDKSKEDECSTASPSGSEEVSGSVDSSTNETESTQVESPSESASSTTA